MAQAENTQALVLQQPNGQKIYLDLTHSTDWVVAVSIIMSGFISFIGFLITVHVVRESTNQNIISNKQLVEAQNNLKNFDLKYNYNSNEIDTLRKLYANYFSYTLDISSTILIKNHLVHRLPLTEKLIERLGNDWVVEIRIMINKIVNVSNEITIYLNRDNDKHMFIINKMNETVDQMWKFIKIFEKNEENIANDISNMNEIFEIIREELLIFIQNKIDKQKGE